MAKPLYNTDGVDVRAFDRGRGAFDPRTLDPKRDGQTNPQGSRHPFKTHQDNQPVKDRARYQRWATTSY